eukprot:Opistho-2@39026
MDRRVGRPADRRVGDDGVVEGVQRHDLGGLQVLMHHFHDALAGQIGGFLTVAIGRGNRGGAGQHHAQRFGQRIHGAGGTHGVAEAGGRRGRGDQLDEAFIVDLAGGQQLAAMPYDRARTGPLALVPTVQHRADRQGDGGDVDGGGSHQQRRGGLVAAAGQDHAVERIAIHGFDQTQIGEVAVQAGGGALAGFLNRVDREFQGDAAHFANAFAHAFGQHQMVAVAGRQVAAGLSDADDRLATAQFFQRQAEIEVPLQIERGHVDIVWVVEPGAAAQLRGSLGRIAHRGHPDAKIGHGALTRSPS